MYKVLFQFRDPEHGVIYHPGDRYPANGKMTTPARIAYLRSAANKIGRPLIEPDHTPKVPAPPMVTETPEAPKAPRKSGKKK